MPSNGVGTAALVLGIVSVVGFCLYGIVGLVTGILAIVFGVKGRRKADNGEATNRGAASAGLILGWIGSVLGLLVLAAIVIAIVVGVHESRDTPFHDGDPFATSLVIQH
jgi:heme/copper-type cytochrome/quinol oxidase subunit 2